MENRRILDLSLKILKEAHTKIMIAEELRQYEYSGISVVSVILHLTSLVKL